MPVVVPVENFSREGTTHVQFDDACLRDAYSGNLPDFLDLGASGKKKYFVLLYLLPRNASFPSIVIVDV